MSSSHVARLRIAARFCKLVYTEDCSCACVHVCVCKYYHCIFRTNYLLHIFIIIILHKCADDSVTQGNAYIDFDFHIRFELPQYLLWAFVNYILPYLFYFT